MPDPILDYDNPDLQLLYTMDNISGTTLVDESPNNQDGFIDSAVQTAGIMDQALNFPGTAGVDTSYRTTNGTYAISCWVNVDDFGQTPEFQAIYSEVKFSGDSRGAIVAAHNGKLKFQHYNFGTTTAMEVPMVGYDGVWVHIVCVRDNAATMKIYVSGVEEGSVATGSATGMPSYDGDIGRQVSYGPPFRQLTGSIDQFRIFNRVLTQAEITALYEEPETVITCDGSINIPINGIINGNINVCINEA